MFIIILYASLFMGVVYGIFKFFYFLSNSLLLIDETFINYAKNINDKTVQTFIDENDLEKEDDNKVENHKKINRHLRLDFMISLVFGIFWYLFPSNVMKFENNEKLKYQAQFVGKSLGLLTLLSSLWPLFYIKNKDYEKKKKILIGKFMCTILVIISFLIIILITKKTSIGNIISILISSFWLANGYYGVKL